MTAVDTPALMAIVLGEAKAVACIAAFADEMELVAAVTGAAARRIAAAYARWGRGIDPAGLNFGDCFASEVAREHSFPLLYVGDDFAKTDLAGAI